MLRRGAGPAAEEHAIVPDPVETDLSARAPHQLERAVGYRIPLRDEVPRRHDPVTSLDLEHARYVLHSGRGLHVVSHHDRESPAIHREHFAYKRV